jgi:pimeloyl-ACP methyl ester carboxylesterase
MRLLCLFALALLASCTQLVPPTPEQGLTLRRCGVPSLAEPVWCGGMNVPENRALPPIARRYISLNVVVIPAVGAKTLPPLYDLAGGPGVPATHAVTFWATAGSIHRQHRDIVLIDQRGTGSSAPLRCDLALSDPLVPVLELQAVQQCRLQLEGTGDVAQYSTAAAVADLDAVRAALGHERIDLQGLSYGTRVGQEYLRAHPQRVRAMALLGTLSPTAKMPAHYSAAAESVLRRLAGQCAADRACRKAIPGLLDDVAALEKQFAKGPIVIARPDGTQVDLQPGRFWEAVRAELGTATTQRRLPWLLHEAAAGRFEPLLAATAPQPDRHSDGALLAVSCPEDTLHVTTEEIAAARKTLFGDYRLQQQLAACRLWGVPPTPARPGFVASDVPTLLLAGDMDHVTPPEQAREVAAQLPNARVAIVPGLGHFPDGLTHMECYDKVINDFFVAGSAATLDLSCLATMQPPSFQTKAQ